MKSNFSVLQGLDNLNMKAKSGFGNGIGNKLLYTNTNNCNKSLTKPKVSVDLKRKKFSQKRKTLNVNVLPSSYSNVAGLESARSTNE